MFYIRFFILIVTFLLYLSHTLILKSNKVNVAYNERDMHLIYYLNSEDENCDYNSDGITRINLTQRIFNLLNRNLKEFFPDNILILNENILPDMSYNNKDS